jgi:hypothetical protein
MAIVTGEGVVRWCAYDSRYEPRFGLQTYRIIGRLQGQPIAREGALMTSMYTMSNSPSISEVSWVVGVRDSIPIRLCFGMD